MDRRMKLGNSGSTACRDLLLGVGFRAEAFVDFR